MEGKVCQCEVGTPDSTISFSQFLVWCCPTWKKHRPLPEQVSALNHLENHCNSLSLLCIQQVGMRIPHFMDA